MAYLNTNLLKRIDLESHFEDGKKIIMSRTSVLYNEDVISTKEVETLILSNTFFGDGRVVVLPSVMADRLANSVLVQDKNLNVKKSEAV